MTQQAQSTYYRCCYRYPSLAGKVGWPDGFARTHWMADLQEVQQMVDNTKASGGEAFIESGLVRASGETASEK